MNLASSIEPIKIPLQLVTNTDKIHQYSQRNNTDVYQFSTMVYFVLFWGFSLLVNLSAV
jgi:hypothetical protein